MPIGLFSVSALVALIQKVCIHESVFCSQNGISNAVFCSSATEFSARVH